MKILLKLFLLATALLSSDEAMAQLNVVVNTNIIDVSCSGLNNGIAELEIFGGVGPYDVLWINSGNNGVIEAGLGPGSHPFMITDLGNSNAISFHQVSISEPEVLVANFTHIQEPTCECDGAVYLEIYGGTPPYALNWPSGLIIGNNGFFAEGVCPDATIALIINDANWCTTSAVVKANINCEACGESFTNIEADESIFIANSGDWDVASNWSGNQIPNSSSDAYIPGGRTCHVPAGINAVCNTLCVDSEAELTFAASAEVNVLGE